MNIFLSYSSRDLREAEDIALALQGAGHRVFFDRSKLSGGEDFHRVIQERIRGADKFVFLITPNSNSEWWNDSGWPSRFSFWS